MGDIVVTGRRHPIPDASEPRWLFTAVRPGGANGSAPVGGEEAGLYQAIAQMKPGDRLIVKIEGAPTVVLAGADRGSFFDNSFNQIIALFPAIVDGRIDAQLPSLPSWLRAGWADFTDDNRRMAADKEFYYIKNTDNLAGESIAATGLAPHPDAVAINPHYVKDDTTDLDGDVTTNGYSLILVSTLRMEAFNSNLAAQSLANSSNKQFLGIGIVIIHEMLHTVKGETYSFEENAAIGVPQGADHYYLFEDVATSLNQYAQMLRDQADANPNTIQYNFGTAGPDSVSAIGGPANLRLGDGDDFAHVSFSQTVVFTGAGNDFTRVSPGAGHLFFTNDGGFDTIELSGVTALNQLAVEQFGGYLYVGVKGYAGQNVSASELDQSIVMEIGRSAQSFRIGNNDYSLQSITNIANSKPDFYITNTASIQAPFTGGFVATINGADLDGDSLVYSVIGVTGMGRADQFWFQGSDLMTSFRYNIPDTRLSLVTVRVSDGELYQDYDFGIEWTPDPYSPENPYARVEPSFDDYGSSSVNGSNPAEAYYSKGLEIYNHLP